MMHPEDEANTDAPLVPDIRGTDRTTEPTTAAGTDQYADPTGRRPTTPYPNEPDPLQPHLGAIRGYRGSPGGTPTGTRSRTTGGSG